MIRPSAPALSGRPAARSATRPHGAADQDEAPKLRVVLVAGAGRSGSTLLAMMLGSLPGAFAVGELRYLWERGIVEHRLCGCGEPLPACPVWRSILARAFDDGAAVDVDRTIEAVNWLGDASNLPKILRRGAHGAFPELGDLPERLGALYRAVAAETGARTIIDSSKPPTYGWFVGTLPGIELSVIHLVRDPRGTAFSWLHPKVAADRPSGGLMPRKPPWKSALSWEIWNAATELLFRSRTERLLRVRYEDLVADPETVLTSVLGFLGFADATLDSLDGRRFTPGASHTVAGNPSRLVNAPTTLELDTAWHAGMWAPDRRVVSAISAPLALRYGYPVRHPADATVIDLREPPEPAVTHSVRRAATGRSRRS